MMILMHREKATIVCDFKGLQMAMQRSIVNAVIVKTDAYDVISANKALMIQNAFPNLHGYDSHIEYASGGSPENKMILH